MTKVESLMKALDDLAACSEALRSAAIGVRDLLKEKNQPNGVEETPTETDKEKPKEYSLADVRKVLAAKSRAGHTEDVKRLLADFGAVKLSDVKKEDYLALVAASEVIG